MENRINIAELLRYCSKGMKLDCTICNGVKFICLVENPVFPIVVRANNGYEFTLTEYGQVHNIDDAKCVIFPKGKTTWEGFVPPCKFKDGDIVFSGFSLISIFKGIKEGYSGSLHSYVSVGTDVGFIIDKDCWTTTNIRLATEEEEAKLFQAIKDNGYKWNPKTKTLEKLTDPKFKVGDRIRKKGDYISGFITLIDSDNFYKVEYGDGGVSYANVEAQDEWELVPNKFDITTLVPFESKVLVRAVDNQFWRPAIWGVKHLDWDYCCVLGGRMWKQYIPYKGNEHLLGNTNDCDEFYKNWK